MATFLFLWLDMESVKGGRAAFCPLSSRPPARLLVTPPRAENKKEAAPPLCPCSQSRERGDEAVRAGSDLSRGRASV